VGFEVHVEHHSHRSAAMPSSHSDQLASIPQRRTCAAATVRGRWRAPLRPVPRWPTRQLASLPGPYPARVVLVYLCEPPGAKTTMTKARRVTI